MVHDEPAFGLEGDCPFADIAPNFSILDFLELGE
jgi:hypothetical protein